MWHFHSVLWLMLKSHWPAFEQAKAASGPPCRLEKGHKEHAPEWRPLLLPWHSDTEGWRGGGAMQVSCAVKAQIPGHRQRNEKLFFPLSCLILSFHLSVCLPGRQALSMSEYCLYAWIYTHTCTHTHRQACALSVTLFLSPLSLSISFLVTLRCLWLYGTHVGDADDCIE